MKLMRLPRLSLALWLIGVPLGAVGGPRGATAAPASPAAAAAPSTPTAPQPALPGEPGLPQQSPAEPPGQPLPAPQAAAVEGNPDWADTLERIAGSVVSIDVDSTRAFDTEWNSSAQATGFVVDAERGLILTNRHVVTPGPVTAEATFLNREEVQLYPVYRDPVHDFGIYRYNPQKLRFIKPKALQLYPEGAQIGREIRVVGNNAGEQLSILAGTLARLDRDAPAYGVAKYNDFNTFYLQAASGTSGGSSGSPVIDIRGRVVGLNAGGANGAASSFYLPLGRVRRALELIQQGKPVPRGTLYTVFNYMPYDELERLGLDASTEAAVRKSFPRYTGMLVVTEVLPGSPSASVLQPGDILMRLNGRYVTQFEPLEDVIDGSVGKEVELELERGGKVLSAKLPVGDLHAITPSAYAEFGDAVVNTMSYQQARHFNVPTRGVYIANPGYVFGAAGIPRGALILELEGKKTDTLKDFEAGIAQLANGEHATVRYITIDDPNNTDLRALRMDRLWFPARHCDRDDAKGLWDCQPLPAGSQPKPEPVSSTAFPHFKDPRLNALAPSLALVTFDMPYSVPGSRCGWWGWVPTARCTRAGPRLPASIRSSCRCRAPCVSATATSRPCSSSTRRSNSTACSPTRPAACSAPGPASRTRAAVSSRRTPAGCPSTWWPTCSIGCAPIGRCTRSRSSSACCRSRVRATSASRNPGRSASRSTPRPGVRRSRWCASWVGRRPRNASSRAMCCSRSTATS